MPEEMPEKKPAICSSAAECLARGREARNARAWNQAFAFVYQGLEFSPEDVGLRLELAVDLRLTERFSEALAVIEQLLARHPDRFDVAVESGHLARQQRRFEDAVKHFQCAHRLRPANESALVGAAVALRELGQIDESKQALAATLAINPDFFDALLEMGRLAASQGLHEEALNYFKRGLSVRPEQQWLPIGIACQLRELGRMDEACRSLDALLARTPGNFDALVERANLARRQRAFAAAAEYYRRAFTARPQLDWVHCRLANCLRELGRTEEAGAVLDSLLAAKPEHFDALMESGHLARQQRRFLDAIAHFSKARALRPDNEWLPSALAACLRESGQLEQASRMLNGILALKSDHFDALIEAGNVAGAQRRPDQATDYFRRALALRPENEWLPFSIAKNLREQGRFAESEAILAAILKAKPDHFQALSESGYLARRMRRFNQALDYFSRASAVRPGHIGMRVAVANELREMGRLAEAMAAIGEVAEPYDAAVAPLLHQRGLIASFANDTEQALHYFEASLIASPLHAAGYHSLIDELQREACFEEARAVVRRACDKLADVLPFQVRAVNLSYQYCDFERAEADAMKLLDRHSWNAELWILLIRIRILTASYAQAQRALDQMPNQLLQDRTRIAELRARLAWSQFDIETADQHGREWLRISPDPSPALHFLSLIHICNGNSAVSARTLQELKTLRQAHGSMQVRQRAGKGLLDHLLKELRVNPFAESALALALQLPLVERPAALARAIEEEPGYVGSAIAMLISLRRLQCWGGPPREQSGKPSLIPRHVVQFWDRDPPPDIVELMQSWTANGPGFTHEVFSEASAQAFMAAEGQLEVLRAFDMATQPAMKADLFRLCYLYARGGIYADADDMCRHSIESWLKGGIQLLLVQENIGSIGNNFIAAAPKHPLIFAALQAVTRNLLMRQGGGAWWSSGPAVMTTTFCGVYLDVLGKSRLPEGVQIIDCYQCAKKLSMHVPRTYKRSDKHWQSPRNATRLEFTYATAVN